MSEQTPDQDPRAHRAKERARDSSHPNGGLRRSAPSRAFALLLTGVGAVACNQAHPEQNQLVALDLISRSHTPESTTDPTDTTPSGSKRIFVTSTTFNGDLDTNNNGNAMPEADAFCMADANYPGSGTFKAVIVDGTNREACTTANCGGGAGEHTDWVLAGSTPYVRASGGQALFTTNGAGVFSFGTLANSITGSGTIYWTGLASDWTTDSKICTNWTDGSGGANQGNKGIGNATDGTSIGGAGSPPQCNNTYALLCAEQ